MRPIGRWARRRLGAAPERSARDRGALSLELLIVFPGVLMLILLTVHAALWWHARNVALSAAQQGVEAARGRGSTLAAGTRETRGFLDQAGGSISGAQVTGSRGQSVQITVTGHVDTLIPGLTLPISQHAQAATERITEPQ
ncbi:pilus assembly protein (plasmid) [Streptomyces sp. NBC_00445]|uniref:TadE/TadG family type IV pilus assembly protein n=1 Tax=Streptomyces sp. NBC_00445 TaxID=2975745 RepID=UPI002E23F075